MPTGNHTTLTGHLTRDPELRFTTGGQPNLTFGLAVNRRWQNRQSQKWTEDVSFFEVTAWGRLATNTAESLAKGHRVTVDGRLAQRTWETESGQRGSAVELVADDIAASLRYATLSITKNPPSQGESNGTPAGDDPRDDGAPY